MHISILPSGHLFLNHLESTKIKDSSDVFKKITEWFSCGVETAILRLAASKVDLQNYSPTLAYWQRFGTLFIEQTRKMGPEAKHIAAPIADQKEFTTFLEQAPPMIGGEYLNTFVLEALWLKFSESLVLELKPFNGNLFEYLVSYNYAWQKIGHVCFHLAENKSSKTLPFAFLATYTKDESSKNAQHIPLGQALKAYAGVDNKVQLLNLLLPVQKAAEKVPFIRGLIDTGKIFHPQAWSGNEAHKFLMSIQKMEEAGINVKVPNWWSVKYPPRPQVSISIGNKANALMGLNSLLDVEIHYTLSNGELLTKAEIQELLNSKENLLQIKGQWVDVDAQKIASVLSHWEKVKENVQENGLTFAESLRFIAGGSSNTHLEALPEDINQWSKV